MALDQLDLRLQDSSDEDLAADLRRVSSLVTAQRDGRTTGQDLLSAARADYANLLEALYARARYGARVSIRLDGREAADISPLDTPVQVDRVEIVVTPGTPFAFGRVDIAPLPPGTELPDSIQSGQRARAGAVRDAAALAIGAWRQAGHAKARVTDQNIVARHADTRLDVAITIDPGRLITFGEAPVTGDTRVKPGRIRQIAGLPQGERYDPKTVDDATARLRGTGVFRSVRLQEAEEVAPDGSMDVAIEVSDRKPRRIGAGVAVSTQQGLSLTGFWLHRNALGGAERFRVEGYARQLTGAISEPDYGVDLLFERPAVYGPRTRFIATLSFAREDEPDFLSRSGELSMGVSSEFTDTLTGDLALAVRQSEIRRFGTLDPGQDRDDSFTLFSLRGGLTWDRRDNDLNATSGTYLRLSAEPFRDVSGDPQGARLELDARAYRALGTEDRTVLAGRLQFGNLIGPDGPDAPPDFLFYSGGSGTVRGQPYNALGADYGAASLGGRNFIGLSGEVRVGLRDKLSVVGFADAGYAGPESYYDGSGAWHSGAGLGVRYDTLIGPLRMDVAMPVTGDTGDGVQLYLGIGQAF